MNYLLQDRLSPAGPWRFVSRYATLDQAVAQAVANAKAQGGPVRDMQILDRLSGSVLWQNGQLIQNGQPLTA